MKHTPGPWASSNLSGLGLILDESKGLVANISDRLRSKEEFVGNLLLVQAAPELLEAAFDLGQMVQQIVSEGGFKRDDDSFALESLAKELALVISKVRGES